MSRLLSVALAFWCGLQVAHPHPIQVMSRTRLEIGHRVEGRQLWLVGRLTDDLAGGSAGDLAGGLAGQPLRISTPLGQQVQLETGPDGAFAYALSLEALREGGACPAPRGLFLGSEVWERLAWSQPELALGACFFSWSAHYDGAGFYGPQEAAADFQWGRAVTQLSLRVPSAVAVSAQTYVQPWERPVRLQAQLRFLGSQGWEGLAEAPVQLFFGEGGHWETLSGPEGEVDLMVPAHALTGPGRYGFRVEYGGDREHAGAEAQLVVARVGPRRLTLRLWEEGERVVYAGRVSDVDGGLAGVALALQVRSGGQLLYQEHLESGGEGHYIGALEVASLRARWEAVGEALGRDMEAEGPLWFQVEALSEVTPFQTRSEEVAWQPARRMGPSVFWYLVVGGGLVGGVALARLVPVWRARWRARGAAGQGVGVGGARLVPPGLPGGRAGFDRRRLQVSVISGESGVPLPAEIVLWERGQARRLGAWRAVAVDEAVGAREVVLEIGAPGHVTLRRPLRFPLSQPLGVVALVSYEQRVREVYTEALASLGVAFVWGRMTPREGLEAVRGLGAAEAEALGALMGWVERVYFSERVADEAVVAEVERLAEVFQGLRGGGSGQPGVTAGGGDVG